LSIIATGGRGGKLSADVDEGKRSNHVNRRRPS
jgi:hypothetical protein